MWEQVLDFLGLYLPFIIQRKKFLLVDSVRKKIEFINEVIKELNLQNITTSFERAEELIKIEEKILMLLFVEE